MLPVHDAQVRFVVLSHVAVRLVEVRPDEVHAAGIETDQLPRLRQLSAADLNRLAAMRGLTIGVQVDGAALKKGLRAIAQANERNAMEAYFIRHGASTNLMSALFKLRRKVTHLRRRICGARLRPGRAALPDSEVRWQIVQAWSAIPETSLRARYYRLHQEFPDVPIAVLEEVVRKGDAFR